MLRVLHEKLTPLQDCRDFGESLVLYWLSKHGFECAKVDHTGIDLIANNPIPMSHGDFDQESHKT